jgi:hypothetical protein
MPERSTDQSHSRQHVERGMAPSPSPADVGIVAALSIEVGDLVDHLKKVRRYQTVSVPIIEGEYAGKIVAVTIGGAGRAAARRAAEAGSSRRASPVRSIPPWPAMPWSCPTK